MSGRTVKLGAPEPLLSPAQRAATWVAVGAVLTFLLALVALVVLAVIALYRWAL